ncbi:MAG: pyruvate kinase, partial [Oscillospiraceae bacterium]|nr:pyruvate kinase [Oscillospiraceae bacterium]
FTANAVSCRKADKDIVGATPDISTFHKMALYWGVHPCLVKRPKSSTDLFLQGIRAAVESVGAGVEDIVVITAGMPVGRTPYTNTMRVMQVTQDFIELAFEDDF